ncbi:MAG TPA: carboxypeptidase regulatory-like domain-containing protein [Candidatus Dormibacteraeota bacterium]|nr:carboxypeptidase regulatory-like domain-containing protein [Candidatus Dormibacteraeota bacterium]
MISWGKHQRGTIVFFLILAILVLFTAGAVPGSAQVAKGSLSGTVRASGGSRVPMAHVLIQSTVTGLARSVTANRSGFYHASNLPPGEYEVIASAPGFVAARVTVSVAAGAKQEANLVLGIYKSTPAATGQGSVSAVRGVVNSQSVQDLPLNGRSASNLAALQPGVAQARTAQTTTAQGGFGTEMVISGQSPRQNDYTLDGISVNDYANSPPGSAAGVNLGADATKQFSVTTSNYPAQYGRSSGGIVAQTTRSGTNEFHGDVFEYIRNSVLDARNYFDSVKPPFHRNQFGGTLGGPILKSRAFFLVSYEGFRQSQGLTFVDDVPSQAARNGNLSSGTITVDPSVLNLLNAFYPLPNRGLLGNGDTGVFAFAGQQVTPENYFTTRLDDKLTSRDALSGVYQFNAGSVTQPDEFNNKGTGYNSANQFLMLSESHTFSPTLLNSFRFGINRVVVNAGLTFPGANPNAANTSFGTEPGQNAAQVTVPGLTSFTGGLGANPIYKFHFTDIQVYDDFSWHRGKHAFKFGASIEHMYDNMFGHSTLAGQFKFNSLYDFLTNQPYSVQETLPSPLSPRDLRQTIVGAYAEDDWQARPNLTLGLGLRYEMATVISEVNNELSNLPSLTAAQPQLVSSIISNPTLGNFEPRVGVAWDPFGNGKTVLRSGFGMFDVLPLPYMFELNAINSAPYLNSGTVTNLPAGSYPAGVSLTPSDFRQSYFQSHPERSYVMQWNLSIDHRLSRDFFMRIGYIGSRGVHEPFRSNDANIVLPTLTPQGYLWPSPAGSGTRLNPNVGNINSMWWLGDSYYDGLQARLSGTFGRGSQVGVSYTWGKAIDDTLSGSLKSDEFPGQISSPLWFDIRRYRGLAAFDVAQNLTASYILSLGTPKWAKGFSGWALGGWAVGGIFEASSGTPFTPNFGGDPLGVNSSDPNVDVPNLVNAPGCSSSQVNPGNPKHYIKTQCFAVPNPITLLGNLGRNTLIGPGLVNLDFSMFKNNYVKRISDAFNVQFRAEFFNILNHANFAPPFNNRSLFDTQGNPLGNAGEITSTQTPAREIQFALRMIW